MAGAMNGSDERFAGGDGLASFTGKWRGRWPEWSIAEAFLPPAQREIALAWAALQQELLDAAWGGTDARPGEAKLGWWQEELQGWAQGRRRHPLGAVLQRSPAPWSRLAAVLPALRESRDRPVDPDEAFRILEPAAAVAAEIEQVLFDVPAQPGEARRIAATWLATRLGQQDESAVPLQMLAAAGQGDPVTAWARRLEADWPGDRGASRPRRLWAALARARLGAPAQPLAPWRTLWLAWRAARN